MHQKPGKLEVVAALAGCSTESEAEAALLQPLDVPRKNEIFANGCDEWKNPWKHRCWLVVWNIFIFPYIGNNHPK